MIRKMLLVAAAIAMPVGVVAITGGTAGAGSPTPPDPAVTCTVSATVTFAPPGISKPGSITTSKTTTSSTSTTTFGGTGCTGSAPANTITSKATKCSKKTPGMPSSNPACTPGNYGYDSWANFTGGGTASLQKSLKKLSFTVNSIAYSTKTTGASTILPGGLCGGSEAGFQLVGTVKGPKQDKGQTATLNACFGAITGTGLTSSTFVGAAIDQNGTVATTAIDPAQSTLHIG